MNRLPRADLPIIPHAHGNDGMILPTHVLQKQSMEASKIVECDMKKDCDVCGGYYVKVQIPSAVKEKLDMQKQAGQEPVIEDFKLTMRDGGVKKLCTDCLSHSVESVFKAQK